jgi:hypothetical protein
VGVKLDGVAQASLGFDVEHLYPRVERDCPVDDAVVEVVEDDAGTVVVVVELLVVVVGGGNGLEMHPFAFPHCAQLIALVNVLFPITFKSENCL